MTEALVPSIMSSTPTNLFLVEVAAGYLVNAVGGMFFYLVFAGLSFWYLYVFKREQYFPPTLPIDLKLQVRQEISYACWSIPIMAVLLTPFQLLIVNGYGKVYENVDEYGWGYFLFSIPFFLLFTDMLIYFIHRALHWNIFYKYIHKPHHRFRYTTPFSSHSFHPLDGWAQGIPYYIFALLFPIHNKLFMVLFVLVNFWTISIHDQVDFQGAGIINSTGHHTIHHELFVYNYGQYTTLWDRLCGTYKPSFKTNELLTGKRIIKKRGSKAKAA